MRSLVLALLATLIPAALALGGPSVEDLHAKRQQLELELRSHTKKQLDCFARTTDRSHFFLPDPPFDADSDPLLQKRASEFALQLTDLARSAAVAGEAQLAYQLLHEASFFGDTQIAGKIVGAKSPEPEAKLATSRRRRLPWPARSYYFVNTKNYQVVTRDAVAGVEIAKRLETLHVVWRQMFFDYWCNLSRLKTSLHHNRTLLPKPIETRIHRVVVFANREEYVDFLRSEHPRIEITLGYYDISTSTSYFFAGPDSSPSTQLHEVTHQLFQEVQRVSSRLGLENNFWGIEGVAMYMESLQRNGNIALTGGWEANRLQFARYRLFQERFYVPLTELAALGRNDLQRDQRIRQIYSQSAGLTHFLMDADSGRYRRGFCEYLKRIYAGLDEVDSLATLVATPFGELDARYRQFMLVSDRDLAQTPVTPDSLRSLCLGDTDISDAGLSTLSPQANLNWLDLARTKVGDQGLQFLKHTKSLRQVSFDGARVSDESMKLLRQNSDLEELDLSNTQITDKGLGYLANLKSLRTLWLTNTAVTDKSVALLGNFESLEFLAIDGTDISAGATLELRRRLPNLTIE